MGIETSPIPTAINPWDGGKINIIVFNYHCGTMNQGELSKGDILVQRYLIKEKIGVGGMGTVYKAQDLACKNQNVAVKVFSRALDDMKMLKQFQKEATICALLSERSENIVRVTDYGIDENRVPFYVMELLEGENLDDYIDVHDITLEQFIDFVCQICRAMETAHNGIFFEGEICPIIHRDLKPSNIFVVETKIGKQLIKILDFGVAKILKEGNEKQTEFMGTPRYSSPEQLEGKKLDNRSDIYSLGMIMYRLLTKKYPWDLEVDSPAEWYKAHTTRKPNPFPPHLNIPIELERLVLKCLEKAPENRPQNVGEIIQKLESIGRKLQANKSRSSSRDTKGTLFKIQSREQFLLSNTWPNTMPKQKIVFPRLVTYEDKPLPTICAMLETADIEKRKNNIRYSQFLFQSYPHPMILWVTALYSPQDGPRWLPCYIDLKTKAGQQMINALLELKEYFVLLFSLEPPHNCQHVLSFKVLLKQRTNLKQWMSVSNMIAVKHHDEAIFSKRKLKQDLELLKPKIVMELEKTNTMEVYG